MKKSLIVLLTIVMLLISAFPVFAADQNVSEQKAPFILTGRINAIQGNVVTVDVLAGNWNARQYVGQTLALQTTDETRFLLKTVDGTVAISLDDLEVGQNVSAQVEIVDGVCIATRITVGADIIHW